MKQLITNLKEISLSILSYFKLYFCVFFLLYTPIMSDGGVAIPTLNSSRGGMDREYSESQAVSTFFKAEFQIQGKVEDESGNALGGVTIRIKGKEVGTISDGNGLFSLEVNMDEVLVASLVGYTTAEIEVKDDRNLNIILQSSTSQLDQLVVVGYGSQRKKDITGSITSVTPEAFNKGAALSPQQLIQGKVAGVNIVPSSGKPGGSTAIRIRGGNSITASNEPLYVVDGVPLQFSGDRQTNIGGSNGQLMIFNQEPTNPLDFLNPSDIASVDVLKDASATAIYGSRGANGVIIITTKKGDVGTIKTTYNSYYSISKVAKKIDVLDAEEYLNFMQENGISNYLDGGANTNWQDQIFRTAFSHSQDLTFSGGTATTQYRASLSYLSNQGVIISSGIKNYSGRVNIHHKALEDKLTFDLNLTGAHVDDRSAPVSGDLAGEGGNILKDALRFNPTLPVYTDGEFTQINQFQINPVSYTQIKDERETRRELINLSTTYNIITPLSFNVNLGYSHNIIDRQSYIPKANPLGDNTSGRAIRQTSEHSNKLLETTLTYNKNLNEANHLNIVAGYSYQDFIDQGNRDGVTGFLTDAFGVESLQAGTNFNTVSSYKESNKLISFYGRVNYDLLDRYLLTLTLRRDGSSRFGINNKWGTFPSGAVGWRISEESFFPKEIFLSDLKIRASYGVTGNQEIGNLLSQATLGASSQRYLFGGDIITIVQPEQFANPDLKWEQTGQLDLGMDFELFFGRIHGTIDYYKKKTKDLLLSFHIPSPSVVSSQVANVGSLQNQGFEISVGSNIIRKDNFSWDANLNFSTNKSEILSLSNNQYSTDQIFVATASGFGFTGVNTQVIMPGQPMGTFYGPVYEGIENGIEKFKDLTGDGKFSITEDIGVIGHSQPKFIFGVTNNFSLKRFDLNFALRGMTGNDVFNNTALDLRNISLLPGQNVFKAALTDGKAYGQPEIYSSKWIENGSFIRLDNLTLGYTFNVKNVEYLDNLRLYFTGQNIFLITGYSGLDPEVDSQNAGGGGSLRGIDYMPYPRPRSFIFGINVSF